MGLINGGQILPIIHANRLVWIAGRYSGGKTAFAYYLAKQFLKKGYRLVSNTACVWNEELENVQLMDDDMLRAVFVLDEGGLWFKTNDMIEEIAAYAAKMDCVYIIPSYWEPTRAAQKVVVQPVFGFRSAGIPAIFYKWTVKQGTFKDNGWFIWVWPQEVFGVYSRQDPGEEPGRLVDFMVERTQEYIQRKGRQSAISELGRDRKVSQETMVFADSVAALSDAADTLASLPKRSAKRRR